MGFSETFKKGLVNIDFASDHPARPLRCPVTGKVVFGEVDEKIPNWKKIPSVMFHIFETADLEYLSPKIAELVSKKRKVLGEDADDMTDLDIIQEHLEWLGNTPLIFQITWDQDDFDIAWIGLDLAYDD